MSPANPTAPDCNELHVTDNLWVNNFGRSHGKTNTKNCRKCSTSEEFCASENPCPWALSNSTKKFPPHDTIFNGFDHVENIQHDRSISVATFALHSHSAPSLHARCARLVVSWHHELVFTLIMDVLYNLDVFNSIYSQMRVACSSPAANLSLGPGRAIRHCCRASSLAPTSFD